MGEPVEVIHRRLPDMDANHLASLLSGLAPLVVGMFEFQVDRLTPEYVRDFHEYLDEGFRQSVVGVKTAQMRTVPVRADLSADRSVAAYDDIRAYLTGHPGPFSVINCVCRQSAELIGEACTTSSTHETCLMIGRVVRHGREISHEEILAILDRAEREGHVLQPQNSRRPADAIPSAHLAGVEANRCTGCRTCVRRCPMDAISLVDRIASVAPDRCIGCGLCASTCPEDAIALIRRKRTPRTPRTTMAMYLRMYRDRWGPLKLVDLAVRKLLGRRI